MERKSHVILLYTYLKKKEKPKRLLFAFLIKIIKINHLQVNLQRTSLLVILPYS